MSESLAARLRAEATRAELAAAGVTVPAPARLTIDTLPNIFELECGPTQYLLEGLIPDSGITMLTAAAGVGKTFLMLGLMGAVLEGSDFLGRRVLKRPVLALDRENPLSVIKDRLEILDIKPNSELRYWGTWNDTQPPDPSSEEVVRFARANRPLIVIDSMIAFNEGNEQDASETSRFLNALRPVASAGAAVVVIHHTGKGKNTKDYRGSSAISGAIDAGFTLEREGDATGLDRLALRSWKFRTREEPQRFGLRLENGQWKTMNDPDLDQQLRAKDTLRAYLENNPGINRTAATKELSKLASVTRERAKAAIESAIAAGELAIEPGGKGGGEKLFVADLLRLEI